MKIRFSLQISLCLASFYVANAQVDTSLYKSAVVIMAKDTAIINKLPFITMHGYKIPKEVMFTISNEIGGFSLGDIPIYTETKPFGDSLLNPLLKCNLDTTIYLPTKLKGDYISDSTPYRIYFTIINHKYFAASIYYIDKSMSRVDYRQLNEIYEIFLIDDKKNIIKKWVTGWQP